MREQQKHSISLEKFSAYLDGNLPEAEMVNVSELIAKDDNLSKLVNANAELEDSILMDSIIDDDGASAIDFESFQLPELDSVSEESQEKFLYGDIWAENDSSLELEAVENPVELIELTADYAASNDNLNPKAEMKEQSISFKGKVNYGYEANHEDSTFDPVIYQGQQPSCAIRSQEIVMRDYGVMIPQEELIQYAVENGWYSPDPDKGGTPRDATGNLLDAMGIETTRYDNASIYDVISELRAGHRVIVSVDANELWIKKEPNLYKRLFGELSNRLDDKMDELAGVQGANHALIVAGVNVDTDNPSDMKVVLIDSGTGDVCIEYKFSAFKKAWDDSHCHMVATTEPAPFQYNYITHEMEPSSFQSDFKPSMVALPSGLHNEFELPESYFDKFGDVERIYNDSDHTLPTGDEMPEWEDSLRVANSSVHQELDDDSEADDMDDDMDSTYCSTDSYSDDESSSDSLDDSSEDDDCFSDSSEEDDKSFADESDD